MRLWVRSQDKEILKKSNDIIEIRFIKNNIGYTDGWAIFIDKTIMGSYISRKRALEVLDEIQNCLLANFNFDGSYEEVDLKIKAKMINGLYGVIYEMPKE